MELSGSYLDLGQGMDVLYEKAGEDDNIGIAIEEDGKTYNFEFKYTPDSALLINDSGNSKLLPNAIKTDDFIYLSAYRIEPLKFYKVDNKQNIEKRNFGNDGELSLQYLKEHGPDILDKVKGNDNKDLNQLVQEWLKVILPGANAVVDINKTLNISELRFQFLEGKNKTNSYKCVNVGFGLTYVLPILIALLSASAGDLIIIENPEAHIHPAGQRKLGELIAQAGHKGIQIIVETHSDHIMNGIRIAVKKGIVHKDKVNFTYFYKENYEHKCVFPKVDENGKFDEWPEGFFDEWDNSLIDLL